MVDHDGDEPGNLDIEDVPEEVKASQRRNQAKMAEYWGADFTSMLAGGYGFCPSPDGHFVGIEFQPRNGKPVRVSMPTTWYLQFSDEMNLALLTAGERLIEGEKQ